MSTGNTVPTPVNFMCCGGLLVSAYGYCPACDQNGPFVPARAQRSAHVRTSEATKRAIRKRSGEGMSTADLAERYGLNVKTVRSVTRSEGPR